jgi:preprotein translocase subunit SecD
VAVAVLALALTFGAAACGHDATTTDRSTTGSGATGVRTGAFQMRPVLRALDAGSSEPSTCTGSDAATCVAEHVGDRVILEASDGTRYALGSAAVTEDDVEHARAVEAAPEGWNVELELTASATSALAELTGANQGERLAIVVDGVVATTPIVEAALTSGHVEVTGFDDRAAAVAFAEALGGGS